MEDLKKALENNYDLNLVDINSRKHHKSKKEHNTYEKFAKYHFIELINNEETNSDHYRKFVDKILDTNEVYSLYFKDNLTPSKISEKLGVTDSAISKWENGKNIPDISILKQICNDYNINYEKRSNI